MSPLTEATLYRDAGAVKRYHTQRTHRTQNLAEHTFGMLMLIRQVDPLALTRGQLCAAVLHHDLPELFTGDTPSPIKRAHPMLGAALTEIEQDLAPLYQPYELSVDEGCLLKWADRIEMTLWCMEEHRMGNTHMATLVSRVLGWVLASVVPVPARELTAELIAECRSFGIYPTSKSELERQA